MKELSMHILDITENSIRANAQQIIITVEEDTHHNIFSFSVEDDGKGISEEMLKTLSDPFTTSRTMRKVGMGISLLTQNCRMCEGDVVIESTLGVGTTLKATMQYDHIDRPPMGNIASTITNMICSNEHINFVYKHAYNDQSFDISTKELLEELEDVPLSDVQVMKWLNEFIKDNIQSLRDIE